MDARYACLVRGPARRRTASLVTFTSVSLGQRVCPQNTEKLLRDGSGTRPAAREGFRWDSGSGFLICTDYGYFSLSIGRSLLGADRRPSTAGDLRCQPHD